MLPWHMDISVVCSKHRCKPHDISRDCNFETKFILSSRSQSCSEEKCHHPSDDTDNDNRDADDADDDDGDDGDDGDEGDDDDDC